jgi:hypothetical protein
MNTTPKEAREQLKQLKDKAPKQEPKKRSKLEVIIGFALIAAAFGLVWLAMTSISGLLGWVNGLIDSITTPRSIIIAAIIIAVFHRK